MNRTCKTYPDPHDPPRARQGDYTPDQCRQCWHEVNQTDWWKAGGVVQASPSPASPSRAQRPCVYLGERVGEEECKTCRGRVTLFLFACSHPEQPLGAEVCQKNGCGPKCKGYTV